MDEVERMFEKSGAKLNGHFLLASGRHSPVYWEKFQVLQFPDYTVRLCSMFARFFRKYNVQVVAGPTTGGVILAFETARQLAVRGIFAEKPVLKGPVPKPAAPVAGNAEGQGVSQAEGPVPNAEVPVMNTVEREHAAGRVFRRGFKIDPGERVLIVDDILTTGTSLKEVVDAVNEKKGTIVGISVLVDRSETPVDFGVPLFSCLRSLTPTYAPESCPLCAQNIPLVKPGSS